MKCFNCNDEACIGLEFPRNSVINEAVIVYYCKKCLMSKLKTKYGLKTLEDAEKKLSLDFWLELNKND